LFVRLCSILGLVTIVMVDLFFAWLLLWQMDPWEYDRFFEGLFREAYGIPVFLFITMNLVVFPLVRCLKAPREDTILSLWVSLKKAELKAKLHKLTSN